MRKSLQSICLSAWLGFWLSFSTTCDAKAADVDQVQIAYPAILECWKIDNAKQVRTYKANLKGLKLLVMEIDTNEDGQKDGMLLFPIFSEGEGTVDISTIPSYVILDDNYDGVPDHAYFDRTRTGACDTLIEVPLSTLLTDYRKDA